ncbi:site-specific DNA-methyltransferase [Agrobacterium tumefaciens]|uniref:site-specific DNA-methyltransferase n=1 Tax=Agrobacterium tumefaciens TaxID=358 RepID=UPI000B3FD95B|nr:site-specific DNA-methyltransferase [Agrobacterium tumefaciens]NSY03415.1 site-specific DNA-methyltransferase [Agrobacterium tumefaciens]OVE88122.1 site-specific DNA-methyltransferase [Agrobacterium tumefaciens]
MANEKKTPVDSITHGETRANIPPAELEPVLTDDDKKPIRTAWERRNRDLDPQLVWRGKDPDQAELTVDAPPIFLQEQVHPKALIDDLRNGRGKADDLFGHFGLTEEDREAEIEFYRHTRKWSNRMILGDALQVMASLAEREGLKGQVQAIYIDPPYGIKFNSNFQWSTTSRDVKDGKFEHLTREPEQVKAFRDTWRDGIHSYLSYIRDRLTLARELLTDSGSCFVQIGDENVHRVRGLMDEVFGEENFVSQIAFRKTGTTSSSLLDATSDYIVWYAKNADNVKYRPLYKKKTLGGEGASEYTTVRLPDTSERPVTVEELSGDRDLPPGADVFTLTSVVSDGAAKDPQPLSIFGNLYFPAKNEHWKTTLIGMQRLLKADRLSPRTKKRMYRRYFNDYGVFATSNSWQDVRGALSKVYVVQTSDVIVQRCLLMATDPGDLVLDPTCGSGTTAYTAEQWGRRWITIDTSRVALALARARIMGARYDWYVLADSPEGQRKTAEVTRSAPATHRTYGDVRHGFVYERVPHIKLGKIAANTEIDVIWERMQPAVESALAALNSTLSGHESPFKVETGGRAGQSIDFTSTGEITLPSGEIAPANGFMEWEIPLNAPESWPPSAKEAHDNYWKARMARQQEIDASISAKAEFENLYDRPYVDNKRIRVAGPFTVESLSPHAISPVNEHGELIDEVNAADGLRTREEREAENFRKAIMENLAKAGVHQSGKADAIRFDTIAPWPGEWIGAEGRYMEGELERRAAIFIGPEYGTVSRPDLVACAREAADAGFDIVVACAFNFDAHAQELHKLGRVPILHARMNADLHMANDLKAGGGNLFVVFGEPEIELQKDGDRYRVELKGVDIFKPATGEVVSSEPDDIACWFIDTDYSGESFFVRQAYFPGADVPYKALRSTLKSDIDEEAWESLKLTVSRPFAKPKSGRIAVKVINHLGDEVMKVLGV